MSKDTNDEGIPVEYEGGERSGWVRRAPWPVDETGRRIRDDEPATPTGDEAQRAHYREDDVTEQPSQPKRRRGLWVALAVLAALVLALVLWSVFDGTKASKSTQQPSGAASSSSADPTAIKNAVAYETASYAGPRGRECTYEVDAARCKDAATAGATIPLPGLTQPVRSIKTAHVAGTAGNADAALPDNGTPGVTVVLVEIHAKNQPATQYEAVAVRDGDHKVIGTKTVNDENRSLSLDVIGQQIIDEAGQ